ncbi:MAG: hypothetical protein PHF21_02650 [Bacilli bacterium]|nr:hypothetical protein [Bacilli bacterium]
MYIFKNNKMQIDNIFLTREQIHEKMKLYNKDEKLAEVIVEWILDNKSTFEHSILPVSTAFKLRDFFMQKICVPNNIDDTMYEDTCYNLHKLREYYIYENMGEYMLDDDRFEVLKLLFKEIDDFYSMLK